MSKEAIDYLNQAIAEATKARDMLVAGEGKSKEPEYKSGDWVYYGGHHNFVFRIECLNDAYGNVIGTGIGAGQRWINSTNFMSYSELKDSITRKATEEEIKEALVREAKRRYEGVKRVKRPSTLQCYASNVVAFDADYFDSTYYKRDIDTLEFKGINVYCKGEWAEVVEEKKTLLGHEVRKGCIDLDEQFFTPSSNQPPLEKATK